MATIGNKLAVDPAAWRLVDDAIQNQIATSGGGLFVAPSDGFITHVGMWARRTGSVAKAYLAVWKADGTDAGDFLCRTALLTLGAAGANVEGPVAASATEAQTVGRVKAGDVLWIGPKVEQGDAEIGVLPTGSVRTQTRTVAGGVPTDPFGAGASADEAPLAVYVTFVANSAPTAPVSLTPTAGGTVNTVTPTLGGTFADPDTGSPAFDKLLGFEFEVRDNATDALMWSGSGASFLAAAAERDSGVFARTYNGAALAAGTTYKWRVRATDLSFQYGAWSAYQTFVVNAFGQILNTAPTGKVDGPTTAISWSGTYYHPGGNAATDMQIRVLKNGAVYRLGAEFAKAVASAALPGTAFTVASGADGGIGVLDTGQVYTFQFRVKANGQWSDWQPETAFSTNAIPTEPTALEPPSGTASSDYPLLSWSAYDPDADDVEGTDVRWEVEIVRPDTGASAVYTTTAYDAATGRGSLQTTATHVPVTHANPYQWRVRSQDISASDGFSEWSDWQGFVYAAGLVVSVTAPTEGQTVDRGTPTFTWSISSGTQTQYRVEVYDDGTLKKRIDTGVVASATMSHTDATVLENGKRYDARVWVNNGTISGWSARRSFLVSYAPPEGVGNPALSTYAHERDPEPTSVMVSWSPTTLQFGDFESYLIRRRAAGTAFADATIIKKIRNPLQTVWIDYYAPADKAQTYSISVLRKIDGQFVESAAVEADIDLDLSVATVVSARDGAERAVLRWKPAQRRNQPAFDYEMHPTWGTGGRPTAIAGEGVREVIDASFTLIADSEASKEAHLAALRSLHARREEVMYRDELQRFFGLITQFTWDVEDNKIVVRLKIEEVYYVEGDSS